MADPSADPELRSDDPSSDPSAGADVFTLLSNEVRRDIVRELAMVSTEQWRFGGATYAELRRAVGVEDGGKFNYHLGELRGRLLQQDGDAYRFTMQGFFVATALLRGQLYPGGECSGDAGTCPRCDRRLLVSCYSGYVEARCEEHGVLYDMILPPAVVEAHDPATILDLAVSRGVWYATLAMQGACHICWGSVQASTPVAAEGNHREDEFTSIAFSCDRCNHTFYLAPGPCIMWHPDVIAFCAEHGENLLDPTLADRYEFNRLPVEPTEAGIVVSIVRSDEQLRIELDGEATVVETVREPA